MERTVQQLLEDAGDLAGAFLWRRVCRELEGPLRAAVVARDPDCGRRLLGTLPAGIDWVPIHLDFSESAEVGLGSQDRLLGAHALLFATPMTAALGATERRALDALDKAGCPERRGVILTDGDLLERLSDNPEAEKRQVEERLRALLPESWPQLESVALWTANLNDRAAEVRASRLKHVAAYLLEESAERIAESRTHCTERLATITNLLDSEDTALEEAKRRSARIAAHTLGVIRRQTERLELDLKAFLRDLEGDLPTHVHSIEDLDQVRRTLPHWLAHVVETWMADRLGRWRKDVLEELEELEIEEFIHAELLVPSLQPAPVRGEARWGRRLGTTAAFGGAAALLALGLWIPGLVAIAGGVAWSTFNGGESDSASRQKLITTGREALRQMGTDAERLLADQLSQLTEDIEALSTDAHQTASSETRADLESQAVAQRETLQELTKAYQTLVQGRADLGDA